LRNVYDCDNWRFQKSMYNTITQTLRDTTLVFLVHKNDEEIATICLAQKKRGFGVNRWNGVGGKVEGTDATIEGVAKRETLEEIGVDVEGLDKTA